MFKNRNRSVRKKIEIPSSTSNYSLPEKLIHNNNIVKKLNTNCFGEPVHYQKSTSPTNFFSSDLKTLSDVPVFSFDKSSSSSASWGEEYELEATQKVQNELNRMEKVLLGLEPIPSNYDNEEYKLWLQTFPSLSITGEKIRRPPKQIAKSQQNHYEELIVIHPDRSEHFSDCDITTSDNKEQLNNDVKSAVITRVYKNVSKRLFPKRASAKSDKRDSLQTTSLETDFEDILRISPIHLNRTCSNRSSHSVSQSHILASRWLRDNSPEFTSLPFLPTEQIITRTVTSISAKSNDFKHKNITSLTKSRQQMKHKNVTLPPINSSSLYTNNQFRSISATPRNQNKTLSAISVQVDTLQTNRSRLEVANLLAENELIKRNHVRRPRRLEKINKK